MTNEEAAERVRKIRELSAADNLEEADMKRWTLFLDLLAELTKRGNLIQEDLLLVTIVSEVL